MMKLIWFGWAVEGLCKVEWRCTVAMYGSELREWAVSRVWFGVTVCTPCNLHTLLVLKNECHKRTRYLSTRFLFSVSFSCSLLVFVRICHLEVNPK